MKRHPKYSTFIHSSFTYQKAISSLYFIYIYIYIKAYLSLTFIKYLINKSNI